jgi:hypothetical protein
MKPDWRDAPSWANYLAMDQNKQWIWFEKEPTPAFGGWTFGDDNQHEYVFKKTEKRKLWYDSLEQKPKTDTMT